MSNNVASLLSLDVIKSQIELTQTLFFYSEAKEDKIGAEFLELLHGLFPRQNKNTSLSISDISDLKREKNYLLFTGLLEDFYACGQSLSAIFCLYDDEQGAYTERHFVFNVSIPKIANALSLISHNKLLLESDVSTEINLNSKLLDSIETIDFDQNLMLFSSKAIKKFDVNNPAEAVIKSKLIPSTWGDASLERGINFLANTTLNQGLAKYLYAISHDGLPGFYNSLLVGDKLQTQGIASLNPVSCVIFPDEYFTDTGKWELIPHFKLIIKPEHTKPLLYNTLSLGFEYTEFNLITPIAPRHTDDIDIYMLGNITFELSNKISLGIQVSLISNEELIIDFFQFPSLLQLLTLISKNGQQNNLIGEYFGDPFDKLLDIQLTDLQIAFDLLNQSISSFSFSVAAKEQIPLIKTSDGKIIIGFKPELNMQILDPLNADYRSVEGELSGIWKLGKTRFNTVLSYPDFDFYAGLAEHESIDVDEVIKSWFSGVEWPNKGAAAKPTIKLTKMEVTGNYDLKTFTAEIEAEDHWEFSLGKQQFGCNLSRLLLDYTDGQISVSMEGNLKLFGTDVFVNAFYSDAKGWLFTAGTPVGTSVELFGMVDGLLESLALPHALPKGIKLQNIIFTAAPKLGEYSIQGQTTSEGWPLLDNLKLTIDQFQAVKNSGAAVTGQLRVSLDIDGIIVRLKAEKAATVAGGWLFEGSSGYGQPLPIGKIISWMNTDKKFGEKVILPESIESFYFENIRLSFNSSSKDFFFTCEGIVNLPGISKPVRGVITIDIKYQQDESFTKVFAGSLFIDGLEFDLLFESSHQSGGKDTKTFVASYYDDTGHTIEIGQLLQAINPNAPSVALGVNLKDALFAYQQLGSGEQKTSKFLLGVDIDAGLNLSDLKLPDLPLIGQPFPPGQTLKLALQVLYANQAFDKNELDRIGHLSSKGFKLPQQPVDQLKLVALLKIGQETKTLDLPIGIDKDNKELEEIKKSPVDAVPANAAVAATTGFTKWIKIQKTFGPIHVERLGVGVDNGNLVLLLDSALSAAGLSLSLDGLGAEFTLKDLSSNTFKPYFHLNGLGLDYKNGPLEIGGSFLKQQIEVDHVKHTSFAGLAIIRTTKLSLSAIGSYMQNKNGDPSLFVYAVANYPLGGPSFFFVTGFAAGFGYNRALTLPPIDEVASFPLVAEAVANGGPENLPSGQKEQQTALTEKLKNLEKFLPPSTGEIFVAAGIKFTSFNQIDSFALLALKFGRHFEIDLLGYSTLTAPPPKTGQQLAPIAQAHLALKASFVPDEGFLAVRAQLTPNSYIFSTNCQLSGGFAFYSWFDPHPNAGDFVLTLGGYHSKFIVPEHYPKVPRLAINWQVNSKLHVKADAYFALTGSALMAGGHLQVVYQHDKLKAWFNAGADFIVAWQPYYYEAEVYVDIGVSYSFEIFGNHTVTADLGANLHLWGPEFCGQATVHWSIISFTVKFGEQTTQQLHPISWTDFQTAFLPKLDQVCTIGVNKGLIRQLSDEATKTPYWIINAKELMLSVQTIIPFNLTGNLPTYLQLADQSGKLMNQPAVAAMGLKASELTSQLSIAIKHNKILLNDRETFRLTPILKAMPAGLWGEPQFSKKDPELLDLPDVNKPQLIDNMLVGFELTPIKLTQTPNNSCTMNIAVLQDQLCPPLKIPLTWQDFSLSKRDAQDKEEKDPCGNAAWQAAKDALSTKSDNQAKLFAALGIVNAVVDYGESINKAQVKTA